MAKILQKSHAYATALYQESAKRAKCGKNEDPAKITYSKMAFFSRPCSPCDHEQMLVQARAHQPHEPRASAAAAAWALAATAADVAVRAVRGGGARAAHLDNVDGHREEVDPPLGGDSTRLGLEPRLHRQLLPLEMQQHVLDENMMW